MLSSLLPEFGNLKHENLDVEFFKSQLPSPILDAQTLRLGDEPEEDEDLFAARLKSYEVGFVLDLPFGFPYDKRSL